LTDTPESVLPDLFKRDTMTTTEIDEVFKPKPAPPTYRDEVQRQLDNLSRLRAERLAREAVASK
jgi:hypothetical protein